jgi:hypothetical protein
MIKPVARVIAEGGEGDRPHPMSSVCIDVRPARLVERAAAPSGPSSFALWEREAEGAQGSEERRSPGGGGGLMH